MVLIFAVSMLLTPILSQTLFGNRDSPIWIFLVYLPIPRWGLYILKSGWCDGPALQSLVLSLPPLTSLVLSLLSPKMPMSLPKIEVSQWWFNNPPQRQSNSSALEPHTPKIHSDLLRPPIHHAAPGASLPGASLHTSSQLLMHGHHFIILINSLDLSS